MRTHAALAIRSPRVAQAATAVGLAGLAALVAGTFLPWLQSGRSTRNSYAAGGALRRLLDVHGIRALGLDLWPFVGLWCAAVTVAFAFGYRRMACVAALVVAIVGLSVGVGALVAGSNGLVKAAKLGPIVSSSGASLLVLAATVLLLPGGTGSSNRGHR